uniref:E3 ubiquitin-protein ligase n=1 Tax=Panagrellus redivivus TaxID=6233 RepID=A0A7E4VJZ5_PANRE
MDRRRSFSNVGADGGDVPYSDHDEDELPCKRILPTEVDDFFNIASRLYQCGCSSFEGTALGEELDKIPEEWRADANRLFDHVNTIMGEVRFSISATYDTAPEFAAIDEEVPRHVMQLLAKDVPFDSWVQHLHQFHSAPRCNVVWRQNTVAYRCQTCGLNSCMSLCAECFEAGNHEGHDYSRFFSTVGGCCDCGNPDVMDPKGFCQKHCEDAPRSNILKDHQKFLIRMVLTRLIIRLLVGMRRWSLIYDHLKGYRNLSPENRTSGLLFSTNEIIHKGIQPIFSLLARLCEAGSNVTDILIDVLLDKQLYAQCQGNGITGADLEKNRRGQRMPESLDWRTQESLVQDTQSLEQLQAFKHIVDKSGIHPIQNDTLLDELLMYQIRIGYPQELIDTLLNLLYDTTYKQAFASKFFAYYPYTTAMVAELLNELPLGSREGSRVAERIVHISVQICSGAKICLWLQNRIDIVGCALDSILMMSLWKARPTLLNHEAVRFYSRYAEELSSAYERGWLTVSIDANPFFERNADLFVLTDLQNLFVHQAIAEHFFASEKLVNKYLRHVCLFQGSCVEWRIPSGEHRINDWVAIAQRCYNVEFEACSLPMHSLAQHLASITQNRRDTNYVQMYTTQIKECLQNWFNALMMDDSPVDTFLPPYCITFHIPLHRHLAVLLYYTQTQFEVTRDVISNLAADEGFLKKAMLHPLRLFAVRAEFYAGMWTRNGQGMRMSVANYSKPTIAFSFLAADLVLLRFSACNVNQEFFLSSLFNSFHIPDCFAFPSGVDELSEDDTHGLVLRKVWIPHLLDGALRLLLDLIVGRRDMEPDSNELLQEEIIALLARQDLPYSHIRVVIPNRGNAPYEQNSTEFDAAIDSVANFVEPDRDNSLQHGRFELKRQLYDTHVCPVFCRLRSFGAVDFNEFSTRLEEHDRKIGKIPSHVTPWLGYRLIDFDKDYANRFETVKPVAALLTQPSFFAFVARVLNWTNGLETPASLILQQAIYLLSLSCQVLRSEKTFEACRDRLFRHNDYQESPFHCDAAFSKSVADAEDPRAVIAGFFCIDYGCGKTLINLILDLFNSAVRKKHPDVSEEALYNIIRVLLNPERLQSSVRLHGGCTLYVVRLLNLMTEASPMLSAHIKDYIDDKFRPKKIASESASTSDGPAASASAINSAASAAAKKKAANAAKRDAFLAKLHAKNASRMKTHMANEGITQEEMDQIETKSSSATLYECPICGEMSDHSIANVIGVFVHTRPNGVVANSVPATSHVTDLMELAPNFPPNRRMRRHTPTLNRRIYGEQRDALLSNDMRIQSESAIREVRFRTGVEVRTCRHFAHISCFKSYLDSIIAGNAIFKVDFTVSCPMCRSPVNAILPLRMEFGRDMIRANFFINDVERNCKALIDFYKERLYDPRPIADHDSPLRAQITTYREAVEAFEDLPYRQLINTISDSISWHHPEGRFKGFDARMSFVQCNVDRLVMAATVDLPLPKFSKGSVIEHIMSGAITLLLQNEQKVIFKHFTELLSAAAGRELAITDSPPYLCFDFQSLFLRCVALPMIDERFVSSDREDFIKLVYRIITPILFTRAIFNAISRADVPELITEFLHETDFGPDTIIARGLQATLEASRAAFEAAKDTFFIASGHYILEDAHRRGSYVRYETVAEMRALAIKDANLLLCNLTKFAIMLKTEVFKKDMLPEEVAVVRGNDYAALYSLFFGEEATASSEAINLHSVARSGGFFVRQLAVASELSSTKKLPMVIASDIIDWKYRSVLNLPPLYDKLFSTFFGQRCESCYTNPRHQMLCLLCGSLMCLTKCNHNRQTANGEVETYIERHTVNCGGGCCVYLSLNSTMVVINYYRLAVLWGTVYLDAHGEEDRNLCRGKPLFLSQNRMNQLRHGWYIQDLDRRANLRWISLEQLSNALKQCHHGH